MYLIPRLFCTEPLRTTDKHSLNASHAISIRFHHTLTKCLINSYFMMIFMWWNFIGEIVVLWQQFFVSSVCSTQYYILFNYSWFIHLICQMVCKCIGEHSETKQSHWMNQYGWNALNRTEYMTAMRANGMNICMFRCLTFVFIFTTAIVQGYVRNLSLAPNIKLNVFRDYRDLLVEFGITDYCYFECDSIDQNEYKFEMYGVLWSHSNRSNTVEKSRYFEW